MKSILGLTVLCTTLLASNAWACPKSATADHLTLVQVMANFGSFLISADLASMRGKNDPQSVSESDMQTANNGIAAALDCADTVLSDTTGQLYPDKYFTLPADKQAAFLVLFKTDMGNFRQGLAAYQQLFFALSKEVAKDRNFTAAAAQEQSDEDLVNKAHDDLR